MKLGSFILRRFLFSIFVLFGLSILIFIIARVIAGDPARMILGERVPEEVVQRLRQEMYLDKTLLEQYLYWGRGILSLDFGYSFLTSRPVLEDIKEYFPATMELAIFSATIVIIFSVLLGTLAARYKDTWFDNLIRMVGYIGVSSPSFVIGIIFILLFGFYWPVLPVLGRLSSGISPSTRITGLLTVDNLIQGNFLAFWDAFKHLILPSIALSLARIVQNTRVTRGTMVDNMRKEFVFAERGYGIPERVIMFKYLLKPSMIPAVSMMGLSFANLFANSFLVEMIFIWPGISRYGINAILSKDLNVVSIVIILFGVIFVGLNLIVDIIEALLDPRIRFSNNRGI